MNIKASKEVNKTNQGIRYIKAYGFWKLIQKYAIIFTCLRRTIEK